MKAIIQRVTCAKVVVDGKLISEIGKGLCILVGICSNDTLADVDYMSVNSNFLVFQNATNIKTNNLFTDAKRFSTRDSLSKMINDGCKV